MPGHVLVAFEFGSVNGGENSFLAVAESLQQQGWTFTALAPQDSPIAQRLTDANIDVVSTPTNDSDGLRPTQAQRREQLARVIDQVQPDLIHCNSLSMSRLLGPVCRDLNIPSLGYLRDIIKISRKAMDDINQLDCIVAVSEATRSFHVQHGLSDSRSVTIHNGIEREKFLKSSASSGCIREELKLPNDAQLLLSCGQIGMRKGLDTLVKSFIDLADRCQPSQPAVHLLIVGQRHSQKQEAVDYERNLLDLVRSAQRTSQVHFLGRRSDIGSLMRQSTLLVHAARQEPLGRVLLEASAVGLPIVATDVGGTKEVLPLPEFQQHLVSADDPDAMANAIQNLLANGQLRQALSQRLQRHAVKSLSVESCADHLSQQYKSVLTKASDQFERS